MEDATRRKDDETETEFHERVAAFQEAHADHAREQQNSELANRAEARAATAHQRADRARERADDL